MQPSREGKARRSLLLAGTLLSIACGSDEAGEHEHGLQADRTAFYQLLGYTHATPVPQSLAKVVATSTAIAVGSFEKVEDGRIIDFREGASNPIYTAVFSLSVQTVIKGDPVAHLYAEFPRAIVAEIDAFKDSLPAGMFVFILHEPGWVESAYQFQNAGAGLPPNERLQAFHFPFGIAAQGEGALEYPLMADMPAEVFASTTLEALTQEIVALGAAAP